MLPLHFASVPRGSDVREIAGEVRSLLGRSIERALAGTKRVAVLAGGGTDSSALLAAVLAHARGASSCEVDAISLDFGGPGDDRPYMRVLAEHLGIVPLRVGVDACAAHFLSSFVVDGAPLVAPGFAWSIALTKAARARGADVVMSGLGGDELFEGDLQSFTRRARRGDLLGVWDALRLDHGYFDGTWERMQHLIVRPLLRGLGPRSAVRAIQRARRGRRIASVSWYGEPLRARAVNDFGAPEDAGPNAAIRGLATAAYLADIADNDARVAVAGGTTSSAPFLDEDLVEFLGGLPPQMFFAHHRHRGLLREVMLRMVPDRVRLRRDKWSPTAALNEIFLACGGVQRVGSLLRMRGLSERGVVRPEPFERAFRAFAADPRQGREWVTFWPVLASEALLTGVPADDAPLTHWANA
jgi:asparagine synthetase B (glutamine-hydrolysing)